MRVPRAAQLGSGLLLECSVASACLSICLAICFVSFSVAFLYLFLILFMLVVSLSPFYFFKKSTRLKPVHAGSKGV